VKFYIYRIYIVLITEHNGDVSHLKKKQEKMFPGLDAA